MNNTATSNTPWPTVKLGDVCEVVSGQSPEGVNYTSDSSFVEFHQGCKAFGEKFLQTSNVYTKEVTKLADADSIVMSVRAPVGTVNITQREICIGRGLCTFIPANSLLRDYLYNYFLASNEKLNDVAGAGSVFPSISRKQLMGFPIPLPPLEVQREIVAKVEKGLEEADALATHFKRLAALADETFKAELDETFQSLSAPTVKLGDVCEIKAGATHHDIQAEDGAYPVFGSGGYICQATKFRCPANTVTVGRKGTLDKPLLIEEPFWNIDTCFGVIPGEKIAPRYLWHFCQNFDFYHLVPSLGRPSTNSDAIKSIFIPLPPLAEQQSIVAKLEAVKVRCERLKAEAERGLKAAEALRKAVLAEAFEQ
ncbi:MAG: restriction endonuclease subunit S [bacterium]|nr:restriction endonuclease subunit S [bacterium]